MLNPSRQLIHEEDRLVLVAKSQEEAQLSMQSTFMVLPQNENFENNFTEGIVEDMDCIPVFEGKLCFNVHTNNRDAFL